MIVNAIPTLRFGNKSSPADTTYKDREFPNWRTCEKLVRLIQRDSNYQSFFGILRTFHQHPRLQTDSRVGCPLTTPSHQRVTLGRTEWALDGPTRCLSEEGGSRLRNLRFVDAPERHSVDLWSPPKFWSYSRHREPAPRKVGFHDLLWILNHVRRALVRPDTFVAQ